MLSFLTKILKQQIKQPMKNKIASMLSRRYQDRTAVLPALGIIMLTMGLLTACGGNGEQAGQTNTQDGVTIESEPFGTMEDGREVTLYTLRNENGTEVEITNFGGIVTAIRTADAEGNLDNVVLGFDSLEKYLGNDPYFGAIIGRYGNRIANGTFTIDGTEYTLATNDGDHHLHGGVKGFNSVLWDARPMDDGSLQLTYLSEDGEEGYPGNLDVTVTYSLTNEDELKIDYKATTDEPTPVNLTNHSYFNLSGHPDSTILDHRLMIHANRYTPVDEGLIPIGQIVPVEGTPFDFTEFHRIGARIDQVEGGYDHNFVLNDTASDSMVHAATLYSPQSGRQMKVFTTEPGLQFYSGNFLDGSLQGPDGTSFVKHAALCLETQHFPNSPNEPEFPSTILRPGEQYHTVTVYQFSTR